MYICARARARVHALCVLSGTFVGVRVIFVGARARVYAVCVRVHICTHIIFIPIV